MTILKDKKNFLADILAVQHNKKMSLQTKAKELDLTKLSQRIMLNLTLFFVIILLDLIKKVELSLPKEQRFNRIIKSALTLPKKQIFNLIVKIVLFLPEKQKLNLFAKIVFTRRLK